MSVESLFGAALMTFLMSMVPVLELRAAIPWGAGLGMPWYVNYLIAIVGNSLPVPFILLFIRAILDWMKRVKGLSKIALWLEAKAEKNSAKVNKYAAWGLFLFVAIPLPGTGAWTGSLVAAVFRMRLKHSLVSVICGVLTAGLIVTGFSYGVLGFLSFML